MYLYLILFEIRPDSPAFIIGQCVSVFLEKCVDTGDSSVPRVFQIFQGQSPEAQNTLLRTCLIVALITINKINNNLFRCHPFFHQFNTCSGQWPPVF